MKKIFFNTLYFYYTSYYKFFKMWQSDENASDNAKGMISLNIIVIYLIVVIKFIFPYLNKEELSKGSNLRFLIFMLCIPVVYGCMKLIKSYYPNNENKRITRGVLVSITLPFLIFLFIIILKK